MFANSRNIPGSLESSYVEDSLQPVGLALAIIRLFGRDEVPKCVCGSCQSQALKE